jgi:hypothetical protein
VRGLWDGGLAYISEPQTELAREPQTLDLRLELRAENLGIERVFETVAHERRVIVFDVHIEVADMGEQKIQDRVVVGQLQPAAAPLDTGIPHQAYAAKHFSCPVS